MNKHRKGIILAGRTGGRLYPSTSAVAKSLLGKEHEIFYN